MKSKIRVPVILHSLLKIFIPLAEEESLLGDMEEMYIYLAKGSGKIKAGIWYIRCAIRLIPSFIINLITGSLNMFKNHLKTALRVINKYRGYSIINFIGLACGMAAFILIALYLQFEHSWDQFHEKKDRIYRVQQEVHLKNKTEYWTQTPFPLARQLRKEFPQFEQTAVIREIWGEFLSSTIKRTFFEPNGFYAYNTIFDIFTIHFLHGEGNTSLSQPFSIILSKKLAEKYFPGEEAVGKMMRNSQGHNLKVTAIYQDFPENSHLQPDYFISYKTYEKTATWDFQKAWDDNSYRTYVLLTKGQNGKVVEGKVRRLKDRFVKNNNKFFYFNPLAQLHLKPSDTNDFRTALIYYGAIAVFILILACINFVNLTTAYTSTREKEIGIRKVIGGNRASLFRQFIGEAVLISMISTLLAFILAEIFMPQFNRFISRDLSISYFDNWPFILVMLGIGLLIGILSGSYPAFVLSSFKPVKIFKSGASYASSRKTGRKGFLRRFLVVFQFSISMALICSTVYVYQHIKFMQSKDLGFEKKNLLFTSIDGADTTNFEVIRSELLRNSAITNATCSQNTPFRGSSGWEINWEGADPLEKINSRYNYVTYDFIDTFGMEIVKGRNFSREFSSDMDACLVNETLVKTVGWKHPIGKRLDDNKFTVIGVIKDFHPFSVHERIPPYLMLLHKRRPKYCELISIRTASQDNGQTKEFVQQTLRRFYPNRIFEVRYYDQDLDKETLKIWNGVVSTFKFFTVLALLIAVIGLFGLVSFSTERRAKEISIRKVLGATMGTIYSLVVKEFLWLLIIANAIGLPIAYMVALTSPGAYKYKLQTGDFALPVLFIFLIAISTTGYKALKAARTNPVDSLRNE